MSKFNLIAVAIAASLAAPAAFAVEVNAITPDVYASNAIVDADVAVANGAAIQILAEGDDNYLGRSTGYNVRVTLGGGATFATAITNDAVTGFATGVTGVNGEEVSVAGGGQLGDTSVTFSVVPATGVVEGDGISIAAGVLNVDNVEFLANGGALAIDVRIGDPVGGQELASKNGAAIASAEQYWTVTYAAPGNIDARIDVGSDSGKTVFSSNGVVNTADSATFNAGSVTVGVNADVTNPLGLDLGAATAPLTITGEDFSAFLPANGGSIVLTDDSTCAAGTEIAATIAADGRSASIAPATTAAALNTSKHICFTADEETIIAAQNIGATLTVKQASMTDSPVFTDAAGNLLDMAYNGAVERVWHFNPASNADQQSYLRLTNTSTTAGLVTVVSTCDNGVRAAGTASLTVAAGQSVLLTSGDIENGNAGKGVAGGTGGCATGKNRLEITGEFASMQVQNFLRNTTSAGLINTNVNNEK